LSAPSQIGKHFTSFVDLFFIVGVTLGVEHSVSIFATGASLQFAFLVTAFIIIGLSWVFYHDSTDKLPYVGIEESGLRFFFDAAIAFVYFFLILSVDNYTTFTLFVCVIYLLYFLHGLSIVLECGWFQAWPLKPTTAPSLWGIFSLIFLLIAGASAYLGGWVTLVLVLTGIGLSRFLRHSKRVRRRTLHFAQWAHLQPRPVIALDIDGVLAEQVPQVLARAEKEMGVRMTKEQITAWDTPVGGTPFDRLIAVYLLDPEFVITMPVVEGASFAVKTIRTKCKTFAASNRPKETEQATIEWLTQKFNFTPDMFQNTTGTEKSDIAAHALIDDYIPNLKSFTAGGHGRKGILFSQPWNTHHDEIAELESKDIIKTINGWKEIGTILS
jgi:5'(3')-deoxyribonucleotidase